MFSFTPPPPMFLIFSFVLFPAQCSFFPHSFFVPPQIPYVFIHFLSVPHPMFLIFSLSLFSDPCCLFPFSLCSPHHVPYVPFSPVSFPLSFPIFSHRVGYRSKPPFTNYKFHVIVFSLTGFLNYISPPSPPLSIPSNHKSGFHKIFTLKGGRWR